MVVGTLRMLELPLHSKLALAIDSTLGRHLEHTAVVQLDKLAVGTLGLVVTCNLLSKLGPKRIQEELALGLERRLEEPALGLERILAVIALNPSIVT